MPGNEVEDGIHSLFELDDSLQGQHLPLAVDGTWPGLDYNQCVGKRRQIEAPQNFNLKSLRQLDFVRGHTGEALSVSHDQNYTQLSPTLAYSETLSGNHQLNTKGFLLASQGFGMQQNQPGFLGENTGYDQHNLISGGSSIFKSHQENESCESPTLTTNSERSEITEASTDLNFLKGQHPLLNIPYLGIQQPLPMQQSGYNDTQLLQQHLMIKQLQDLQRQQQLQQVGDVRQQNTLNQLSAIAKQSAAGQFSPLINGTPVHEASQMFMNIVQRCTSPTTPGVSNRSVFPQDQGQAFRSMGLSSQQLDASLYGTPVASARSDTSQYSQLGISNDAVNLLTKAGGQAQKRTMQSSGAYLKDQYNVSPDQLYMSQGALITNSGFQGKDMFGPASVQSINSGNISGSFQAGNAAQINASAKDLNGRQRDGWPAMQQKTTQIGPSHGLVPLDPMEEKILYNMDDNFWDAALGGRTDLGAGGFSNVLENSDFSNSFPSIQSGSWSALMQSAVAEASSSDTGLQEEWSGLTFQNTELSTDNQLSNLVDSDKQHAAWIDGNLQSASSFSSKPMPMFNDSGGSCSFPGFQQLGTRFSTEQAENLPHDVSHGTLEKKSPNVTSEWVDCGTKQKQSFEGGQQAQSCMHLDNAWAGQMYEQSDSGAHQRRTISHKDFGQPYTHKGSADDGCFLKTKTGGVEQVQSGADNNLFSRKDSQINNNQSTGLRVIDNNRSDYMRHAHISATNESEISGQKQHQISNGPHGFANSFEGEGEIYVNQQKRYQRQASNDSYNSKGLSGRDQGHSAQVKFLGDVSSGSANFNEVRSPLEEVTSGDDINSVGPDASKTAAQTSQNMLELLHKVNLPREGGSMAHSGSIDSNALANVPEAEAYTSVAELYKPSSASQGFGLRLALPSQRLPNSNLFLSQGSPQTLSYLKSGQINQTRAAPPYSFESLASAHELSQRAHMAGKSGTSGQTGVSSSNMQGSTIAAFASSLPHVRNQTQMQHMPNSPVAFQSSQVTLSNASRNHPFNLATSQDTSQQLSANQFGQRFPVLEASQLSQPSIMPGMSRQAEFSVLQNSWTTLPTQPNLSVLEPLKVPANLLPSTVPTDSSINSYKGGYGEMQAEKGRSLQQMSSDMTDSSQPADFSQGDEHSQKHCLNASALPSSLLLSHSNQDVLDGMKHDNNQASVTTERNFAPGGHSLKSSNSLQQNYSLLHQIQAMSSAETDLSKSTHDTQQVTSVVGQQLHENNSRLINSTDSGPGLAAAGDNKMLSFFTGSREDQNVKPFSHTVLRNMPSHESVRFGQNSSQSQSSSSSYVTNYTNHGQGNLHTASSWLKQFGPSTHGQMLSISDSRITKSVSGQFFLLKPTQNSHIHASVGQVDAVEASQAAISRANLGTTLVANEHFPASIVLPSSINNQNTVITRLKKRKAMTSELLPWCKEVSHGSQKPQNISVSEQEWAEATSRLYEKVEDEVEILGDVHPILRSKRRLVLTTQLMQLLLHPARASILRADAASNYDSVSYFVSRVALGDACCLSCGERNNMPPSSDDGDMISEELKTFEKTGDQKILEVMENFTDRAKKLENNFQRLDKKVSALDIRVECQEMERVSVINRFARFHIRGQGDTSGAASSSSIHKPVPQRYVTAVPMPRNLPEGVQCFSL